MKAIKTILYGNDTLAVLVEEKENTHGYVDYFINGYHVTEWKRIKPEFQTLLTSLANILCDELYLIKWSY
jgi:hypothetical protein